MTNDQNSSANVPSLTMIQAKYLAILPRIEHHGRVYFRFLRRFPDRLEEALAEMVAISWKWFHGLAERGKDATRFPTVLADFAARAVRCGRRVCGQGRSTDVMSSLIQQRHSFVVQSLPRCETSNRDNPALDALEDNTRTPPPDQAAFRIDFPAWVHAHTERTRRLIADLMMGERTLDVSRKFGLTPGRISQVRRELLEDWRGFCGELAAPEGPA